MKQLVMVEFCHNYANKITRVLLAEADLSDIESLRQAIQNALKPHERSVVVGRKNRVSVEIISDPAANAYYPELNTVEGLRILPMIKITVYPSA